MALYPEYQGCAVESVISLVGTNWAVFFFIMWGLYTGMEATRKAPQGYRLCEGRLRAPTRDTFAYAKRLREEFLI